MVIKIHVVYCGAWGYEPKYKKFRKQLFDEFTAEQIEVTGEGTPTSTGYFEVEIVGGKLIHSKKNGDGYVDSAAKLKKIVDAIKDAF